LKTSFSRASENESRFLVRTHSLFHIQSKAAELVTKIVSNNRTVIYLLSSIPILFFGFSDRLFFALNKKSSAFEPSFCEAPEKIDYYFSVLAIAFFFCVE
jgi:hypothetical protein